ncbi:hypothetical protein MM440_03820 [Arsenicicoccus piscis]|nr:hypothetical protein [Arsenicicoccus piscis]MCH8626932.1 hypothetical protein [Arsenicicoccus piscis]
MNKLTTTLGTVAAVAAIVSLSACSNEQADQTAAQASAAVSNAAGAASSAASGLAGSIDTSALSKERVEKALTDAGVPDAAAKADELVKSAPRSVDELKTTLGRLGINQNLVDEVLKRLQGQ